MHNRRVIWKWDRSHRDSIALTTLHWRHNGHESVSNHQPYDCLLNRLFRRRSKKTSKLRVTGLCAGNSPGTGKFPVQMASNAEKFSIWWRHHAHIDYQPSYVCLHLKRIQYTIYKNGCHTADNVNENTECCRSVKQHPKPANSLKRNKCILILKLQLQK